LSAELGLGVGVLYHRYHNSQVAFYSAAALAAVALVCELGARRPEIQVKAARAE